MNILGVSPFHDSSVCVLQDGELVYFCKEERLSRVKRDPIPLKGLLHIKDNYKIDKVAYCSPSANDPTNGTNIFYIKKLFDLEDKDIIQMCDDHHEVHACLAYKNAGWEEALCFVMDRNGSVFQEVMREAETVYLCRPDGLRNIHKNFWIYDQGLYNDEKMQNAIYDAEDFYQCPINALSSYSITKVYESATTLIGENPLENGKTMGLASWGYPTNLPNLFDEEGIPKDKLFHITQEEGKGDIVNYTEYRDGVPFTKEDHRLAADFAHHVQKQTQERVLKLVKEWVEKTGINKVIITGGYGLNVVTNNYLIRNMPETEFFFEPIADDSGNSIGAALRAHAQEHGLQPKKLEHTFINHEVDMSLKPGRRSSPLEVAQLLADGNAVAIFKGKAEGGPRSLGNRSILFDPRIKNGRDIVNRIKKREWYRPFACSVLKDKAHEYFDMMGLEDSPFMTINFDAIEDKIHEIPAVVHVDGTCRIQTVDQSIPHYYEIINEFYCLTGVPLLLNTSFNLAGEALVQTGKDAVHTAKNSDLEYVYFVDENLLYENQNGIGLNS
jgi:carbamoyltransferase